MVVSLLLLLVMTVLALAASQGTRMQERMAGNARDHDLALQSAEAGLRAGERALVSWASAPNPCTGPPCLAYELGAPDALGTNAVELRNDAWWDTNATKYAATSTLKDGVVGDILRLDPTYFIEDIEETRRGGLSNPQSGPPPLTFHYRITSRGVGGSTNSAVVLQSTWARKY